MRRALLAFLCLATSCQAHAPVRGGASPPRLDTSFLQAYTATRGFRNGRPAAFAVTPKGDAVLFLRSEARSVARTLFEVETATGKEKVLATAEALLGGAAETLTAEEKARRERMRLVASGIAAFELSRDGRKIRIETLNNKAGEISAAARGEQISGSNRPEPIDVDDEHFMWKFNGEFWKDELGYYRFRIRSKCAKK